MGIKQLTKLLNENAPLCMKCVGCRSLFLLPSRASRVCHPRARPPASSPRREQSLSDFTGRKIAIDASMAIYQFLVAVRTAGAGGAPAAQLTNEAGEVTSHLQGLWYRTLKFVESGIKPVYVFDGKPPALKGGELAKRKDAKVRAGGGGPRLSPSIARARAAALRPSRGRLSPAAGKSREGAGRRQRGGRRRRD